MSRLIATFFGVGYLKPAPGTWGSVAACLLALLLSSLTGIAGYFIALAVIVVAGIWAIGRETIRAGSPHDASEWVIDEVAGQWVALIPAAVGAHFMGRDMIDLWPGVLVAFIAFRIFDIAKPLMVGQADRKSTAFSVMEDDLWAGSFAAVVVGVLAAAAHLLFL